METFITLVIRVSRNYRDFTPPWRPARTSARRAVALALLGQALGFRWSAHHRLFVLAPTPPWSWRMLVVLFTSVLCVATPIKIWNNARLEHRLQEQEKHLLAAMIARAANQIKPQFTLKHNPPH